MATWSARGLRDVEIGLLSASPEVSNQGGKWVWARKMIVALLVGFALGCAVSWLAGGNTNSSIIPLASTVPQEYPLNFLVLGDWGRKGEYNQTEVAKQMGRVGEGLNIEFVISAGDNFYDSGLTGVDDIQFDESFRNIYTAPSLQTTWYTILGNHDYMGDVLAQLDEALVKRDSRWFCKREFQLQRTLCASRSQGVCHSVVDFFFIDTSPFVNEYWAPQQTVPFDWRGLLPREQQLQKQLQDLDQALRNSSAAWKIVVGHHTIRSVGHHGDTVDLLETVLPVLEANNVDMYINGHDHNVQHIKREDSKIHFITSGGGSKCWQGIGEADKENGLRFAYDGQSFISVSMATDTAQIVFHDAFGNVLNTLDLNKGK